MWPGPCAGPALRWRYVLAPPDSPFARHDVQPPSLGSSPCLSENNNPFLEPRKLSLEKCLFWVTIMQFCVCVVLRPWLEPGWAVPRLSSHPQRPPPWGRFTSTSGHCVTPSVPQDQVPDNQGQRLCHQNPLKFFELASPQPMYPALPISPSSNHSKLSLPLPHGQPWDFPV